MKRFFESAACSVPKEHETNLLRLPSTSECARHATGHDSRAFVHWKAGDAGSHRWHCDGSHSMFLGETKRIVHRRPQRVGGGASTEMHARGMNDMTTWQFARSRDRRLSNLHGSVSIALVLNRRPATHADRARYSSTQHQLIVSGVDNRIDTLLRQVAGSDHDSRRRHSSTSATRSPNSSGVAFAIPFTPIDEMVIDAHATPHTSASCRPPRWPPVLNHRASMPPASASPAPVVSTTGRSVRAGTRTTPSSM